MIVLLLLAGCGEDESSVPETETVTVFAAASLTDAFEEIAAVFEAKHDSVDVALNFAGSGTLATQINEGAPAEVFASANETQMQTVQDAGNVQSEPEIFARNRLVVIVHHETEISTLAELAGEGVSVVFAAPGVPVRDYTDQALAKFAESPDYGDSYVSAVMENLVSEEADVRAVVLKVSLGEADAGIVYASDVTPDAAASLRVIEIPDAFNVIASYPIAATSDSQIAQDFVDFVLSDEGQTIIAKWGLIPVNQ